MSFRVLGTNHTSFTVSDLDRTVAFLRECRFLHVDDAEAAVTAVARYGVKPISPPVTIDQGPNRGRKVVYVRDWDGVTLEFIEVATQ